MLLNTSIMGTWQNWLIIPIMAGFFFIFVSIISCNKKEV